MENTYKHLVVEKRSAVYEITLSNEKQLNALHAALFNELESALDMVYAEASTLRGVILRGAGQKAFAAGADISSFLDFTQKNAYAFAQRGQSLFAKIESCPVPVIAAIHGYALGGGCELALSTHLRLATKDAKFGLPELKLGLIPGYGGTQRLVQLIGKARALEWILSGKVYGATQALEQGLLCEIVDDPEALMSQAHKRIDACDVASPEAIAAAIRCINLSGTPKGYEEEAQAFAKCSQTENGREGVRAFLEKRPPRFTRPAA